MSDIHAPCVYTALCYMMRSMNRDTHTIVALHNVRSAHNVGAIFRTADGAGVDEICLIGYTPLPIDRFGRAQGEVEKTALGAEKTLPWKHFETFESCKEYLVSKDIELISIEQSEVSKDYRTYTKKADACFIFGNEVEGLPEEVLHASDQVLDIPMRGKKESLNVSVSAGVILYHALD